LGKEKEDRMEDFIDRRKDVSDLISQHHVSRKSKGEKNKEGPLLLEIAFRERGEKEQCLYGENHITHTFPMR